jgi:small subunit ribosomal protein S4e
MYKKRNTIGKFWPVAKKGTKYVAAASHNQKDSIPLLVVMRDILKLVENKKELKGALNNKQITINHKEIRDTNYPVHLLDVVSIPRIKKNYKATLSPLKKMIFDEVSEKESERKPYKVIGKKILSKNIVQVNLMQGENVIMDKKSEIGDSVILNLKTREIVKIIPMKKGENVFVVKGKYSGKKGKIEEIIDEGNKKIAKINYDGDKINVWVRNILVTE